MTTAYESLERSNNARDIALGFAMEILDDEQKDCERHGAYTAKGHLLTRKNKTIWSECPGCKADREKSARIAEAERKHQQMQHERERRLDQSAIPVRFLAKSLDNFKAETAAQKKALSTARDYLANFADHYRKGRGLVFAGPPGVGKSHLAISILRGVLTTHFGVYVTCSDFVRAVRNTWHREAEKTETQVLDEFSRVSLLVLDEIGVAFGGTEAEQKHLFDLLDRRYREMLPTILLTNEDPEGLRRYIGSRVYDRLTEVCDWVPFTWTSYRAIAGKADACQ
jgi:DNA replication protein DnaC